MAPRNADLIRPIYEEWGRGNWRPSFEVYHPDMEWGWSDEFPGLDGVYADRRDPNPRLRSWLSGWERWRVEAEDYLEVGDHVIVLTTYRGRGKGSGVELQQQGAHVFELRDGKVVRLEIFADRERAIASVRAQEGVRRGPDQFARDDGEAPARSAGREALFADRVTAQDRISLARRSRGASRLGAVSPARGDRVEDQSHRLATFGLGQELGG